MQKRITKKWLQSKNVCEQSLKYIERNNYIGLEPVDFIQKLMVDNRFFDASWLMVRIMNKKQKVKYAVFAAKQVLNIFENENPVNTAPRKAVEAAEEYLKNPCKKTKQTYATYAAVDVDNTVYATIYAAIHATIYAADATDVVDAAIYAVDAAAYVIYAADVADAADATVYAIAYATVHQKLQTKIINNGLFILKKVE